MKMFFKTVYFKLNLNAKVYIMLGNLNELTRMFALNINIIAFKYLSDF